MREQIFPRLGFKFFERLVSSTPVYTRHPVGKFGEKLDGEVAKNLTFKVE